MKTSPAPMFTPNGLDLLRQIAAAEAKFDASRRVAMQDRFDFACRFNQRRIAEARSADCRRYLNAGDKA